MSDFGKRYRLCRGIASLCVALFIVNMAFCLMCTDKYIYKTTYAKWIESEQGDEAESDEVTVDVDSYTRMSQFQAEMVFQELSDDFLTFFGRGYELSGYELDADNVKCLNKLKLRFRKSVVVVILSLIGFIYSNAAALYRRRELAPLLYGSVMAVLFMSLRALFIVFAKSGVKAGIKAMILHRDYGYFGTGDVLCRILPPDYARFMGLLYIIWVAVLVLAMLLIRRMVIFAGRPHKY